MRRNSEEYAQGRRIGDPFSTRARELSSRFDAKTAARLWSKVVKTQGCWLWQGAISKQTGYGSMSVGPRGSSPQYVHRIAWALSHGPIPAGQSVLHHCDNPICVNPAHLFLGTQLDNMRDASQKGRLSVPRKRTREFKPVVIAKYLAGGTTYDALAAEYGVAMLTVCRWVRAALGGADQRIARHTRAS